MFCFGPLLLFCGEFKTTIREKREEIKHKSTDLYLIKSKKVIWEGKQVPRVRVRDRQKIKTQYFPLGIVLLFLRETCHRSFEISVTSVWKSPSSTPVEYKDLCRHQYRNPPETQSTQIILVFFLGPFIGTGTGPFRPSSGSVRIRSPPQHRHNRRHLKTQVRDIHYYPVTPLQL